MSEEKVIRTDEPIVCPKCGSTDWRCWDERVEWFQDKESKEFYEWFVGYLACRECRHAWADFDGLKDEHIGTYEDAFGRDDG